MSSKELHILNGDFALELWSQCGFKGKPLVWKETYLEGPLPETDDLHRFRTARAEYLSTFDELKGINQSQLYLHLQKMEETLLDLPEKSELILWFDSCIFDQTLLMRILSLMNRKKTALPEISLYCCSGNILTSDDFKNGYSKRTLLLPEDLETAEKAWILFQRKDAEGLIRTANQHDFRRMPTMKKALFRCAEEFPDHNGLNRTQRQILH